MKNEESKKEIKIYKKQNSNQDHKKTIDNNKKSLYNNIHEEKSFKSIKYINESQKLLNIKNNEANIYKFKSNGSKLYNKSSNKDNILKNININNVNTGATALKNNLSNNNIIKNNENNNNENNEPENSFESKMFYEVNNKNLLNFNTPVKTINVYRNNFFNYTNNNLLSNLLCDISDDNKNIMVSELDLNISNSQSQTIQHEQPPSQRKVLEKQNTEIDFRSQLESNLIKILEKNIISDSNNKNKGKNEKKSASYKNTDENNIKNKEKSENNVIKEERKKKITDINMNNIKIIGNKNINYRVCIGNSEKNSNINNSNKYLSKVNKREIKNKYFVSSAKARKSRGLKSPNINVHKVNSIISPNNKNCGSKKMYFNNYTKTDIGIKKYKTIYEHQKNNNNVNTNNNQIDSVKYYNQIKQNKNPNTTSKKAIKSYIIYNHNINNNKIYPNNNHHCIYKISEKNNNIMLTNNSNNNCENTSNHQKKKNPYSKYKNILNELHKNLSKHYHKKEEKINNSKANSHRNKKNQTYLIFNLENSNGRKSPKKEGIFSSNTSNTIFNKYNLNSINNINNESSNKNIIIMNRSIDKNLKNNNKINVKIVNNLSKQNSDISIIHSQNKAKSLLYQKKRWNKNNSCQLNQKINNILSDSIININYKLNDVNKIKNNKFKNNNNNVSLFGVEKINIEMNKKGNNSNIDINPKDIYEEKRKLKNKTLSDSQLKKKNFNQKKSNKKNIINKKANNNKIKHKNDQINYNVITFRNKFIYDDSMKKYLSNSKDNKHQKTKNKLNKHNFENNNNSNNNPHNNTNAHTHNNINSNNNLNFNYNNSGHFSPINKVYKEEKNYCNSYFYNSNPINNKNKSNKNIMGNSNKINIDINFNNNINYIYIIKKNNIKNKSNNHLFTMK